jgi:hypothetical protein
VVAAVEEALALALGVGVEAVVHGGAKYAAGFASTGPSGHHRAHLMLPSNGQEYLHEHEVHPRGQGARRRFEVVALVRCVAAVTCQRVQNIE